MRAAVADMIPLSQRATAYGLFSVFVGISSLLGGVIAGGLYTVSVPALICYSAAAEAVALVLLIGAVRRTGRAQGGTAR